MFLVSNSQVQSLFEMFWWNWTSHNENYGHFYGVANSERLIGTVPSWEGLAIQRDQRVFSEAERVSATVKAAAAAGELIERFRDLGLHLEWIKYLTNSYRISSPLSKFLSLHFATVQLEILKSILGSINLLSLRFQFLSNSRHESQYVTYLETPYFESASTPAQPVHQLHPRWRHPFRLFPLFSTNKLFKW